MILNQENTEFTKDGAINEEALSSFEKALIYTSSGLITSLSYSGSSGKIIESSSIPSEFTELLKNINGYVSLGVTTRDNISKYQNAHIYSAKALTLDGLNRLCFIFTIDINTIGVCESSGNRGCGYSSLYRILKKKLIENGFTQSLSNNYFSLSVSDTPKFVDVINETITEQINNKYVLVKEEGISEGVTLGRGNSKRKLYFNVAYFTEKDSIQEDISAVPIEDIIIKLNEMIEKIELIKSMADIDLVNSKLKSILQFTVAKKQTIQIKEDYSHLKL